MTYQCNNKECNRTFDVPARIEDMTKEENPDFEISMVVTKKTKFHTVIKHCCPFCESIDFKEVKP